MSRQSANRNVDLNSLSDLCTPWCLRAVATLRIAEHIAAGNTAIDELAKTADCDRDVLHSVLRHLASKGVFEEPQPGRFALNEGARQLLDPARRFDLDLDGIGGRFSHSWATLLTFVRTGRPAYAEMFGLPFWEDLAANPPLAAGFDAMMGPSGHGTPNPNFEISCGWDAVATVVDVGGGTGSMLAEILRRRPHVQGVLVDLAETVARSATVFDEAGVAERVNTLGQSFFDPLPTGAELYLLRKVLNDWPDVEAEAILRHCANACPPEGRVVVMGGVSPDAAQRGFSIELLLVGGRHRSVSEFNALAKSAGLEVVAAERQPAGFVVECRPKSS